VADALFASQVLAIGGALASVFLAGALARDRAIMIGILGGGACIGLLLAHPGIVLFAISVCGFNVLWNFVLPFILGTVGEFDTRGRMIGRAVAMQMLGLGTGPFLAGLLTNGSSYALVELACIFFFLASFALLLLPMQAHRRCSRRRAERSCTHGAGGVCKTEMSRSAKRDGTHRYLLQSTPARQPHGDGPGDTGRYAMTQPYHRLFHASPMAIAAAIALSAPHRPSPRRSRPRKRPKRRSKASAISSSPPTSAARTCRKSASRSRPIRVTSSRRWASPIPRRSPSRSRRSS
jgi:MFS family permease